MKNNQKPPLSNQVRKYRSIVGKLWCDKRQLGKLSLTYLRARVLSLVAEIAHQTRLKRMALPPTDRKPQIIVSLTAIPSRLGMLDLVIKSILWQTTLPDRIILWLSETHHREELGNLSPSNLPAKLLALEGLGGGGNLRDMLDKRYRFLSQTFAIATTLP